MKFISISLHIRFLDFRQLTWIQWQKLSHFNHTNQVWMTIWSKFKRSRLYRFRENTKPLTTLNKEINSRISLDLRWLLFTHPKKNVFLYNIYGVSHLNYIEKFSWLTKKMKSVYHKKESVWLYQSLNIQTTLLTWGKKYYTFTNIQDLHSLHKHYCTQIHNITI